MAKKKPEAFAKTQRVLRRVEKAEERDAGLELDADEVYLLWSYVRYADRLTRRMLTRPGPVTGMKR